MQRNNLGLLKAFFAKWPTLAPPADALLGHICFSPPDAKSGASGRLPRRVAERRTFGLRLLAAGAQRLIWRNALPSHAVVAGGAVTGLHRVCILFEVMQVL